MRELPDRQTKVRRLAIKTATHRAALTQTSFACVAAVSTAVLSVNKQALLLTLSPQKRQC